MKWCWSLTATDLRQPSNRAASFRCLRHAKVGRSGAQLIEQAQAGACVRRARIFGGFVATFPARMTSLFAAPAALFYTHI